MTDENEPRPLTEAEAGALAAELVGMTLGEAELHVRPQGMAIEDRTAPGWYTQEYDFRRITVVLGADGTVSTATPG